MEFSFHLVQFRIKAGLYPENCPTKDQKLAHDADGGIRDFPRRRNEEQANGGDGNTSGKAGYGYATLEPGQFYAFLLIHKALIVTDKESKDERIVAGIFESCGPGLASENTILDMGLADAIHGRIVLVAATAERKVCSNAGGQVVQIALPRRVPVCIGAAAELHVQEDPVLELDKEGVRAPSEVLCLLTGRQPDLGALDGIPATGKHCVQGKDVDGNLALLVEVGQLLDAEGVLVLDPGFQDGAAAVVPGIAVAVAYIAESHNHTRDGAAVNREVRDVDFQHVCCLVSSIRGVILELRIEDYEVLLLMGLKGYLASPEIITCRVEKRSHISRVFQARRPRWV